jgi:sulfate transport system ATP-binding protein
VVIMNRGRVEQDGPPDDVIERPASPFVMNFVGNVNRFPGSARDGRADFGAFSVDYPEAAEPSPRTAAAYARPHELAISRTAGGDQGFWAALQHVSPAGPVLRLEMRRDDGQIVNVDIPRTDQDTLQVKPGERLYVTPRRVTVFLED